MSFFDRTLSRIDEGLSGRILTIPTGIPKYDLYTYGTRKSCYYLYGAETGVGKTKFVREKHIYTPYDYVKLIADPSQIDIEIIDFSLEISLEENIAAGISRKIYVDTGRVITPDLLLGWSGRITPEDRQLIEGYRDYFVGLEQRLHVYEEDLTPNKYHDILMQHALANGTFAVAGRFISECEGYVPHNPNKIVMPIIDTINLGDQDSEHVTVKSTIDRISRINVWFRNKCGFSPIVIQQFNAEISAVDRGRYGIKTPLLRDFEDSKRTTKDANVVYGFFDPMRHLKPDESIFRGYDITMLKSWIKTLHLLKHRNGQSNKFIPLQFLGAVGMFRQLPESNEMTPEMYTEFTRY